MTTIALLFFVWIGIAKYTNLFVASIITMLLVATATYWAIKFSTEPELTSEIYRRI